MYVRYSWAESYFFDKNARCKEKSFRIQMIEFIFFLEQCLWTRAAWYWNRGFFWIYLDLLKFFNHFSNRRHDYKNFMVQYFSDVCRAVIFLCSLLIFHSCFICLKLGCSRKRKSVFNWVFFEFYFNKVDEDCSLRIYCTWN